MSKPTPAYKSALKSPALKVHRPKIQFSNMVVSKHTVQPNDETKPSYNLLNINMLRPSAPLNESLKEKITEDEMAQIIKNHNDAGKIWKLKQLNDQARINEDDFDEENAEPDRRKPLLRSKSHKNLIELNKGGKKTRKSKKKEKSQKSSLTIIIIV